MSAKIKKITKAINETRLDVHILNEDSKFVIITYWWGRGNINRNFQRPCPIKKIIGQPDIVLTKEGILFETMADNWIKMCKKYKCNYICQEYPQFVDPLGYQIGINAKPLFIKKALECCNTRSVVYMDSDMKIHMYPAIFDMRNIDYMARNWTIDARGNGNYKKKTCFDPFVFETSGGIMYFGQSPKSVKLLELWANESKKEIQNGKADDRIISLLITAKQMHIEMNIIQLPIEYLWLNDKYEEYMYEKDYKTDWNIKDVVFSHPECLTEEEIAGAQGAARNRQPKFYRELVENQILCQREYGVFWEYIVFQNQKHSKPWKNYLKYLNNSDFLSESQSDITGSAISYVPYDDLYGSKYNKIADTNFKIIASKISSIIKSFNILTNIVNIIESSNVEISYNNETNTLYTNNVSNVILVLFQLRISCLVQFSNNKNQGLKSKITNELEKDKELELIVQISNDDINYPKFHKNSYIYLSHRSEILYHLLLITDSVSIPFLEAFQTMFRKSLTFLLLIRCKFIEYNKSSSESGSGSSIKTSIEDRKLTEGQKYDKREISLRNRIKALRDKNGVNIIIGNV